MDREYQPKRVNGLDIYGSICRENLKGLIVRKYITLSRPSPSPKHIVDSRGNVGEYHVQTLRENARHYAVTESQEDNSLSFGGRGRGGLVFPISVSC